MYVTLTYQFQTLYCKN